MVGLSMSQGDFPSWQVDIKCALNEEVVDTILIGDNGETIRVTKRQDFKMMDALSRVMMRLSSRVLAEVTVSIRLLSVFGKARLFPLSLCILQLSLILRYRVCKTEERAI